MYISRQEIVDKINLFSGGGDPFLFAIDSHGETGFVFSPGEAARHGILYDFNNTPPADGTSPERNFRFDFSAPPADLYGKAFEKVAYHIKRGDTYLLNLTFQTKLDTDLTLGELFQAGRARFKLYVPGHFVLFSPEPFIRINGSEIVSSPMKGTIDAAVPCAEQKLLADEKEFYEHNTIVDLIRNDLSMVSTNVRVKRFRYIDRIRTNRGDLLQMSSEISGELPEGYLQRLGELIFTLLPAGSVTGAPKEKTVEIIREAESYDRGFYTGIFGFFDGQSLVSAVSIRYIEQTNLGLVFKSGGGITALSDAGSEYGEMLKKIYVPLV